MMLSIKTCFFIIFQLEILICASYQHKQQIANPSLALDSKRKLYMYWSLKITIGLKQMDKEENARNGTNKVYLKLLI